MSRRILINLGIFILTMGCAHLPPGATQLINEGAYVVDVRTPKEFQSGHVRGATNVPHDQLMARLKDLPSDKSPPIVVYCRSGRRSAQAQELLSEVGYKKVINGGGLNDLKKADPALPIE